MQVDNNDKSWNNLKNGWLFVGMQTQSDVSLMGKKIELSEVVTLTLLNIDILHYNSI